MIRLISCNCLKWFHSFNNQPHCVQGLNSCLFYENKNPREYISLVPTSAHSGDGMGNLVALICELTQTMLAKRLMWSQELQAITMEVLYAGQSVYYYQA